MDGSEILLETLSVPTRKGKSPGLLQYHPRSDHHSKVACWATIFDLLTTCRQFRDHVERGVVGFGINHQMVDFQQNRRKDLDLVICSPGEPIAADSPTFAEVGQRFGVKLTRPQQKLLDSMPQLRSCKVGSVLVAVEAKACMTEHQKARPRLYDELSSSGLTINGDTGNAIAACHVMINTASTFVSPTRGGKTNQHSQPKAARVVLEKISELRRRSSETETGFDAIGTLLVECRNDGSKIRLVEELDDGTAVPSSQTYGEMIRRIATIYAARWRVLG